MTTEKTLQAWRKEALIARERATATRTLYADSCSALADAYIKSQQQILQMTQELLAYHLTRRQHTMEKQSEFADLYMKEKINCALWRTYAQWQDNKIKDLPCDITIELPRNPAILKVRDLWQPEHPEIHATVKKVVASETTFTITYTADVKWE